MPLRILTVRQPWASLIVMGHKPVENRSWRTSYRGEIAILAGKAIDLGERAFEAAQRCLGPPNVGDVAGLIAALPRGGIIGTAELWGETTYSESWWFTGPYGLLLRNGRSTQAILPKAGSLSLRMLSDTDEAEVRSALVW